MTPVPGGAASADLPGPEAAHDGVGNRRPLEWDEDSLRLARLDALADRLWAPREPSRGEADPAVPSPTTTSAEKEKFFPPLTTFVTRLMWTTRSFSSPTESRFMSDTFILLRT
jgi:hypothetical protein